MRSRSMFIVAGYVDLDVSTCEDSNSIFKQATKGGSRLSINDFPILLTRIIKCPPK